MSEVNSWSTTAASNNSASPNGFPEGMAPSGLNDSAREVMRAIAAYIDDTDGALTSGGAANVQTLAAARAITAYAAGDLYTFKAGYTNTSSCTLNVDSAGAKNIFRGGFALTGGEIIAGQIVTVVYDGTQFQLIAGDTPAYMASTLFRAVSSADLTAQTAAQYNQVSSIDTETVDSGGMFASSKFTPGVAGWYLCGGLCQITDTGGTSLADGTSFGLAVTRFNNADAAQARHLTIFYTAAASVPVISVNAIIQISTLTDYIALETYSGATDYEVSTNAMFWGCRIK